PEPELVHFLQQKLDVRDHRGQQNQDIRQRRTHFLNQRRGIRQRRCESLVHHQLQSELGKLVIPHRLDERNGGGGVVHDDADGLRPLAGGLLGHFHQRRQRTLCLLHAGGGGLENVLETARGNQVRV